METDPQTISAYLIYLSQHTPVEEQGPHSDLALVRELSRARWLSVPNIVAGCWATHDQNLWSL